MDPLEAPEDVRQLVLDLCHSMGINPSGGPWLSDEVSDTPPRLENSDDVKDLLSSLLLRTIGMEVHLT